MTMNVWKELKRIDPAKGLWRKPNKFTQRGIQIKVVNGLLYYRIVAK